MYFIIIISVLIYSTLDIRVAIAAWLLHVTPWEKLTVKPMQCTEFYGLSDIDLRYSHGIMPYSDTHTEHTLVTKTLTCIEKHKTTTFIDVQKGMLTFYLHMKHILG